MDLTKLKLLEIARGKRFNTAEMSSAKALEEYIGANRQELEAQYGQGEAAIQQFRKDIQERLKFIEDFIAVRKVEESLMTKEDKAIKERIEGRKKNVRKHVGRLTKSLELLDEDTLDKIRNADERALREGRLDLNLDLNQDLIDAYIILVREEVRRQMKQIASLPKKEEGLEKQIQMKDLYEKSSHIVDFIVSNGNFPEDEKNFLKAFLLKKIRLKGFDFIKKLYREVQKIIADEDSSQWGEALGKVVSRFEKETEGSKEKHIKEILSKYNIKISDEDLTDMLFFGSKTLKGKTYSEQIALHLEEIEDRNFEIDTLKMVPAEPGTDAESREEQLKICEESIGAEVMGFEADIKEFKREKYTPEFVIDQRWKELPEPVRSRMKDAARGLDKAGLKPEELLERLNSITSKEDIDKFLAEAESRVTEYLEGEGCDLADLKRLRDQDPNFNIYDYLKERTKAEAVVEESDRSDGNPSIELVMPEDPDDPYRRVTPEEAKRLDTSAYFRGETLEAVRAELKKMEVIGERKFANPHDREEFTRSYNAIRDLTQGQYYRVDDVVHDEKGMPTFEFRPELNRMEQVTRPAKQLKQIPFDDQRMLDSLLLQKEQSGILEDTRKKLSIENFDTEEGLRNALGSLYSEMHELGSESAEQIKKLTKVMSIDHPLTCIRFHAAKKAPFVRRGSYEMHPWRNTEGMPMTYRERAKELLKKAKQMIAEGNYAALAMLFRQGEMADRLYMDAIFFPTRLLNGKDNAERMKLLYETGLDDDNKTIPTRPSEKIPKIYHSLFDLKKDSLIKKEKELDKDVELQNLPERLVDDYDFQVATRLDKHKRRDLIRYQEAFEYDPKTGKTTINIEKLQKLMDPEEMRELVGSGELVMGAGAVNEEELLKVTKERLDAIAKDHPLIAARTAQLSSEGWGHALGGLQYGARKMGDAARYLPDLANEWRQLYWKGLTMYSPMSIYFAIEQAIEHIAALADFRVKFKSYMLMATIFKGTIIGSEFEKLMQAKENERVNAFKEAFDQYGNETVIEKLKTSRDRFEFKQTLNQGFGERGLFTTEDLMDIDVLRSFNKFNPSYDIPIKKFLNEKGELKDDEESKMALMDEIRKSIDTWWGAGQFQGWKNGGISKYDQTRQASNEVFKQYSGLQKESQYKRYWEWLSDDSSGGGKERLKKMHPAEIIGHIENDMEIGWLDSGQTFALMQAMICEGIVKQEHVQRFQTKHINDLPCFTLLEPKEAELCGLAQHWRDNRKNIFSSSAPGDNPFCGFYQGINALPLTAHRYEGKWRFAKDQSTFDKKEKEGKNETVLITAHELQKNRQAQTEWHLKMDNSSAQLFSPSYGWSEIQQALTRGAGSVNGKIEARNHDIVANYRGFHQKFAGYMMAMGQKDAAGKYVIDDSPQGVVNFKRTIWYAFEELNKSCAYAGFLARQVGRDGKNGKAADRNYAEDGSPQFDRVHLEKSAKSGKTNFDELILGNDGPHQRMSESSKILDQMNTYKNIDPDVMSDDLRRSFKQMCGYQHATTLGCDALTGREDTKGFVPYDMMTYDPAEMYKETVTRFKEQVIVLAGKRGSDFEKEISSSLGRMGADRFDISDNARMKMKINWKNEEAKLARGEVQTKKEVAAK